jgi:hypothetical protein
MLHSAPAAAGPSADAFYRSFVPELASMLYPRQVELAKRCRHSEHGKLDRVGATIFPGLAKVSRTPPGPGVVLGDTTQMVIRRGQAKCSFHVSSALPWGHHTSHYREVSQEIPCSWSRAEAAPLRHLGLRNS